MSSSENDETQLNAIKGLLDADKDPNKPKVIKKGGVYTKKFRKYNEKLIKQGKTTFYAPKDKYYDGKRFKNIKYDRRYKDKKIPIKKQKDLKLENQVSTKALHKVATLSYKNYVINKSKDLHDKKINQFEVDMKKIDFKTLMSIIKDKSPTEKFITSTLDNNGVANRWITLSNANLSRLENINKLTRFGEGSDVEYISNIVKGNSKIIIKRLKSGDINENSPFIENEGSFFKYYNETKYDFSRYDIYDRTEFKFKENCLFIALRNGGLEDTKLNSFKTFCNSGMMPLCKIEQIAIKLDICIKISKLVSNQKNSNQKQFIYGNKDNRTFKIGLIDNHYFIIEKTLNTRYSLEHYDEIKDLPNCNEICSIRPNGKYKRGKDKFINSFDLVKILIENKNKLISDIPYDALMKTPYFDDVMQDDILSELKEEEYETNEMLKTDNDEYKYIFFDFETITNTDKHIPYLVRCKTEDNIKKLFTGFECGKHFINFIKNSGYDKVILVAHNFKYDFSFIWNYIYSLQPIISGGRFIGGKGKLYKNNKETIDIKFQDSFNHISVALKKFSKMFNLPMEKEIMPYSIYTNENVSKKVCINEIYKCKELKDDEDKKLFYDNCVKWDCLLDGKVDIIKYSDKYCEIDVDVLKAGYLKHREQIKEVCDLDIKNYLTSASLTHDFMIKEGVYDNCNKISGIARAFIQKCVYGGRVMCADNKKFEINTDTADFDSISCYSSSMVRMEGLLQGIPKVLKVKSLEWLKNNTDGYFIKVMVLNEPNRKLKFPLVSVYDENGIRQYTNDLKGKFLYCDKTMIEDLKEFWGLEFEIICGYYYDEGRNPKINEVIRHLFDTRKQKKKEGNPIQSVYKLLMNSAYGKSLLKPISTNSKIVMKNKSDFYINKYYNFIKDITPINDKCNYITTIKPIDEHFNNCYFGVEVLSMAKRIMNEVMVNCELLDIPLYYTDTDSMHIKYDCVKKIEEFYNKKYGRELIGNDLGQFHIDFELDGAIDTTIKSKKSIYLGKKCYYDYLEGYDKKGKLITGEHIRMKGVPNKCIHYTADKYFDGSVYKLYKSLLKGDTVHFDLLCAGNDIKFEYNGFNVRSKGYYKKDTNNKKIYCDYNPNDKDISSEFERKVSF